MIASVDADGVVKLWDVRKVAEFATINVGPHSANRCAFDPSGLVLAIASNDSHIKWYAGKNITQRTLSTLSFLFLPPSISISIYLHITR